MSRRNQAAFDLVITCVRHESRYMRDTSAANFWVQSEVEELDDAGNELILADEEEVMLLG